IVQQMTQVHPRLIVRAVEMECTAKLTTGRGLISEPAQDVPECCSRLRTVRVQRRRVRDYVARLGVDLLPAERTLPPPRQLPHIRCPAPAGTARVRSTAARTAALPHPSRPAHPRAPGRAPGHARTPAAPSRTPPAPVACSRSLRTDPPSGDRARALPSALPGR